MFIAKVIGNIVSTSKNQNLVGKTILIVQPQNPDGKPYGNPVVSIDVLGSGIGETVLVTSGSSARTVFNDTVSIIDSAIVAIIDNIELKVDDKQ